MSTGKCPHCYIGTLNSRRTTLARTFGEDLVMIPNVEVVVCDVCGEVFHNQASMAYLDQLLGPPAAPAADSDLNASRLPQQRRDSAARRSLA